jgi:catechol 2,3-dioxygenase-like lactoylglutathione lyase family enzyme
MPNKPKSLLSTWSSRVRIPWKATLPIFFLLSLYALTVAATQAQTKRPKILGIAGVTIYVTDLKASRDFYSEKIGLRPLADPACRAPEESCFRVTDSQRLDLFQGRGGLVDSSVGEITFLTDDIFKMQKFLTEHSIHTTGIVQLSGTKAFPNKHYHIDTADPDGHRVGFIQYIGCVTCTPAPDRIGNTHVIHAGFVVRNKLGMDQFYKEFLAFRPYWHGGMKDDRTDWVSLQVPDGTDWIEFMVNVPPGADHRLLGVMNHIALGVPDIHAAAKQLLTNGMKLTETPQIGRDGKWQLNLYDPDDTRVELMEFTPVEKPCCSAYTGPHPKP